MENLRADFFKRLTCYTHNMRRVFIGILTSIVLALVGFQSTHASVLDFSISNYHIDYRLSKDGEGHSTLHTVETITAEFPDYNQNFGIERAIPTRYQKHSVNLSIDSVTDQDGSSYPYSTYTRNNNLVVRIGDKEKYVHGSTTYIITYTQRDITAYFGDTKSDEWYWDTNGTDWRVPIDKLSVAVHIDDTIASSLSGKTACYFGAAGATDRCQLTGDSSTLTMSADKLSPGQNITVAIGFAPHTFVPYQPTTLEKVVQLLTVPWLISLIPTSIVGIILIIWLSIRWSALSRRRKELPPIIAEYLPPDDTSVFVASRVTPSRAVSTAALLDLAVRHYIKIYQTSEKQLFKPAGYRLEITKNPADLTLEMREFIDTLFSGNTAVGQTLDLDTLTNNVSLATRLRAISSTTGTRLHTMYDLQARDPAASRRFKTIGWITLPLSILTLSPLLFIASIAAFSCGALLWVLTDKGLALARYLEGLRLYIRVAEADRIAMLQSPDGAEKVGAINPDDPAQLVKLYERVLPYATLFGLEKGWNAQLAHYYEAASAAPDWYSGSTVFNAVMFSSLMDSLNASTSIYASSSESSSGGSSGGGSSGGGGGGGGGGGW